MTEHTPTPWKVSIESHDDYIVDRHGHPVVCIAELNGCNTVEQKEIAELIVKSVNNHEALKARVKELEDVLEDLIYDAERQMKNPSHHVQFSYEKARSVLVKGEK